MATPITATVQRLNVREVNTRFGKKRTYSFQADGEWYSTGFKNPGVSVGDVISFEYEDGDYGKEVNTACIKKTGGAVPSKPSALPVAPPATVPSSGKGVFPIPPLDGQRSIVRQNALTNARELYVSIARMADNPAEVVGNPSKVVEQIIAIARKFEAYTAGDLDMKEVEAELQEKKAA